VRLTEETQIVRMHQLSDLAETDEETDIPSPMLAGRNPSGPIFFFISRHPGVSRSGDSD